MENEQQTANKTSEKLPDTYENYVQNSLKWHEKFLRIGFVRALHNETFLYVLRRILSSCFTLILLVAVVTALIRMLPDRMFYDMQLYNKLNATSASAATNYKNTRLFMYGRCDIHGKRISVLANIWQYIYYILPVWKKIPVTWNRDYTEVKKYWTGLIYLGKSMSTGDYVIDNLNSRIGISFSVSMVCILFIYLIGVPFGIAMAKKPGGAWDKFGNVFIVLNYAIPALVFYLIMNFAFGKTRTAFNFGFVYDKKNLWTLFPPIFCEVFLSIPGTSIWVRRFMVDELSSDYVKFARSKGLSENKIMYTHVLRNAIVPLVRNVPATFISAIVGSYYIEVIWNIPGTGNLLVTALQGSLDVPTVQGLTVVYAAMSMVSFLLGDLITVFFDPRIKLQAD